MATMMRRSLALSATAIAIAGCHASNNKTITVTNDLTDTATVDVCPTNYPTAPPTQNPGAITGAVSLPCTSPAVHMVPAGTSFHFVMPGSGPGATVAFEKSPGIYRCTLVPTGQASGPFSTIKIVLSKIADNKNALC